MQTTRAMERAPEKATLNPEELAEFLGIGRSFTYQLLRRGEIPSFRIGRLRKVLRRDAERFLEDRAEVGEE